MGFGGKSNVAGVVSGTCKSPIRWWWIVVDRDHLGFGMVCTGVQIRKRTSPVTDQGTSCFIKVDTWDRRCIASADEGRKFPYVSVWDHASFCGGECRDIHRHWYARNVAPRRGFVQMN